MVRVGVAVGGVMVAVRVGGAEVVVAVAVGRTVGTAVLDGLGIWVGKTKRVGEVAIVGAGFGKEEVGTLPGVGAGGSEVHPIRRSNAAPIMIKVLFILLIT